MSCRLRPPNFAILKTIFSWSFGVNVNKLQTFWHSGGSSSQSGLSLSAAASAAAAEKRYWLSKGRESF